jgi:hypothetical protein
VIRHSCWSKSSDPNITIDNSGGMKAVRGAAFLIYKCLLKTAR